ncbi:hypothetical protein FOZ61_001353, partial [Perkinsus olseni]
LNGTEFSPGRLTPNRRVSQSIFKFGGVGNQRAFPEVNGQTEDRRWKQRRRDAEEATEAVNSHEDGGSYSVDDEESSFLQMRIHLVAVGITLVGLVKAEYKRKGDLVDTLSQHGALTHPDHPNEVRYVSDVCHIKDIPTNSASGSLHLQSALSTLESVGHSRQATFVSHGPRYWMANITEELSPDGPRWQFEFQMRTEGGTLKDWAVVKTVDHVMKLETTSGHNDGDAPVRAEAFVFRFSCKEIPHTAVMVTHDDAPVILFHIGMRPRRLSEFGYFPSTRYPRRYRQAQSLGESDEMNDDTGLSCIALQKRSRDTRNGIHRDGIADPFWPW